MKKESGGILHRLFRAIWGRPEDATSADAIQATASDIAANTRRAEADAAALRIDLDEAARELETVRAEYKRLQMEAESRAAASADAALLGLYSKMADPLAQITRIRTLNKQGRVVDPSDLFDLVQDLERACLRSGLELVGEQGTAAEYDPAIHQWFSEGKCTTGDPVVITAPGYQWKNSVLVKASVAATGSAASEVK